MDLNDIVTVFKSLAEPNRIRIAGLLADRPRCGSELASELNLSAGTISHHLKTLKRARLVVEKPAHPFSFYELDPSRLRTAMSTLAKKKDLQKFGKGVSEEKRKVLQTFFDGNRLTAIPSKRKKKQFVFEEILRRLPRRKHYSERQLSQWIEAIHSDFCTIRREFIMEGYMTRDKGIYTLTEKGRAAIGRKGDGWRSARTD